MGLRPVTVRVSDCEGKSMHDSCVRSTRPIDRGEVPAGLERGTDCHAPGVKPRHAARESAGSIPP